MDKPKYSHLLEEKERKEIWFYRQLRKNKEKNPQEKTEKDKLIDDFMDEMVPSMKEYENEMYKAADSAWFAMSELDRFEKHVDEIHGGKAEECTDGCLEDSSIEDFKEYVETVFKALSEKEN